MYYMHITFFVEIIEIIYCKVLLHTLEYFYNNFQGHSHISSMLISSEKNIKMGVISEDMHGSLKFDYFFSSSKSLILRLPLFLLLMTLSLNPSQNGMEVIPLKCFSPSKIKVSTI